MTAEMCILSWGKPSEINSSSFEFGGFDQWVYNIDTYLYFKNGVLTSTSTSKK